MAQYVQENEQVMSTEDLLQAQIELYHHCLAFIKSMALRAATDLRIPDAIHHNGGAATLSDLAVRVGLHPTKLSHLRRLMRVLTLSGIFTVVHDRDGEATYTLTRVSRLLLSDGVERTHGLSQMVRVFVNPVAVASQFSIHEWFTVEQAAAVSLFEVAHGCTRWEMIANDAKDGSMFNAGMVEDSSVAMDIILRKSGNVFQGINSLVDVGGGYGAVAAAVARAFPDIKCTVLDLSHIVAKAPTNNNIQFIGGDLFEFIPAADVVLLKCILHCWQHDDCVKILRRCKEAISARDAGGKVILIEVVVGIGSNETVPKEMQLLFDVFMMYTDGIEREEHEWKKIFLEAGFSDYKITPVLGVRSIIEVYP